MGRPSKLTPEQRDAIYKSRLQGSKLTDLAKHYGVSHAAVWKICQDRRDGPAKPLPRPLPVTPPAGPLPDSTIAPIPLSRLMAGR